MAALLPLITQLLITYGPAAETLISQLIKQWETTGTAAITSDQWANLMALASQTAKSRMAARLTAAGIPLTDPHSIALLALTN